MTDSLFKSLAHLPQAEPDPRRSDRVRSRCHNVLARHRPRSAERRIGRRVWEPLVVGLSGLYFAEVIREALQLSGLL
jgi:hypothetical protein